MHQGLITVKVLPTHNGLYLELEILSYHSQLFFFRDSVYYLRNELSPTDDEIIDTLGVSLLGNLGVLLSDFKLLIGLIVVYELLH